MQVTKLAHGGEMITFSQEEIDAIHSEIAADAGMTLEQYRAMLSQHMNEDWCQCGSDHEVGAFCDDAYGVPARKRNQYCVSKHHWHCAVCDKLIQVG